MSARARGARLEIQSNPRYRGIRARQKGAGSMYAVTAHLKVREGEAVRFYDARLRDYEVYDLPQEDAFDAFCFDRDRRFDASVSLRYVSEDVIGFSKR